MSMDPIIIELDDPIEFPGQPTMTHITIRPYTGKDLLECGLPFALRYDKNGEVTEETNVAACRLLMSRMAAVPPTMIDRMAAVDFVTALAALRTFFFYRTRKKSSTDTSSSDGGAETAASPSA